MIATFAAHKRRLMLRRARSIREESKLKIAFVTAGAITLWLGLFAASRGVLDGLSHRLGSVAGDAAAAFAELLVARLVSIATLTLLSLLSISNLVIAHAGFFRSDETRFLLARPVTPTTLLLLRFGEGLVLSSWASAYLASPVLLAYGLMRQAPWGYYPATACLAVAFALVPAAFAVLAVIAGARALDGMARAPRMGLAAGAVIMVIVALARSAPLPVSGSLDLETLAALLAVGTHPLLPSTWFAEGLMAAADGHLASAAISLQKLAVCAGLLVALAVVAARAWLLRVLTGAPGATRARHRRGLLAQLERLLGFLKQPARALVVKDIRLFWRDPAQWVQLTLFFGLLALYAGNLRGANATLAGGAWRGWIAVLNVAVCLLVLATLTTRFVFPLVSLEGRRWWLLGLAPVSLASLLRLKLALAAITSAAITSGLAALSAHRLGLAPSVAMLTIACTLFATIALCGLAIGLGSLYPNFEQDQAAKIVSGLGGTLCFLLSVAYITLVVAALAGVLRTGTSTPGYAAGVALAVAALSIAVCWLSMTLGQRHLEALGL